MSTAFKPLTLPPGVVATATKKMQSSNYAEVNMVRWVEGQLAPIGGQSKYNFTFASRCKRVHGWYDLGQAHHTAYLCESNLYVETGGALFDITPAGGIVDAAAADCGRLWRRVLQHGAAEYLWHAALAQWRCGD